MTLEGSLKVLIRQVDKPPPIGTLFSETDVLSLTASMPWLNRTLPNFDFNRTVNIQFPIELQNINFAPNLARGSVSNVAWQVRDVGGPWLIESNLVYISCLQLPRLVIRALKLLASSLHRSALSKLKFRCPP